jgi:hypothetical protein
MQDFRKARPRTRIDNPNPFFEHPRTTEDWIVTGIASVLILGLTVVAVKAAADSVARGSFPGGG